jgi:hypothetical protein
LTFNLRKNAIREIHLHGSYKRRDTYVLAILTFCRCSGDQFVTMEYQLLRGSLTQVWFSAVLAAMAPISSKSELMM